MGRARVTVRRLLGAALTLPLLIGGLVLVTAEPAVACTCATPGSDAAKAAHADAVFVGSLISQVDPRIERAQREFTRTSDRRVLDRALRSNTSRTVWTFQVSRVYKGAVGEVQEIVAPPGPPGGPNCSGVGGGPGTEPFLVFAYKPAVDRSRLEPGQYASNLCSGSRPLADGGEPDLTGPRAGEPGRSDSGPSPARLAVGLGVLAAAVAAGLGLFTLRARRRASAD
jgi:hypothetical protein